MPILNHPGWATWIPSSWQTLIHPPTDETNNTYSQLYHATHVCLLSPENENPPLRRRTGHTGKHSLNGWNYTFLWGNWLSGLSLCLAWNNKKIKDSTSTSSKKRLTKIFYDKWCYLVVKGCKHTIIFQSCPNICYWMLNDASYALLKPV